MRMKKKKKLLTLLLSAAIVASAAACGTSTPVTSVPSTESTLSTQSAVSQASAVSDNPISSETKYSDDNDTKVKQMMEKITLNGKSLKIPYKLSDLGDGYTFDSSVDIEEHNGKTYAVTKLMYNDEKVSYVFLSNYQKNQKITDFIAYYISSSDLNENMYGFLQIDNIGINSTKNDILKKFGEPTNIKSTDVGEYIYYEINDDIYISMFVLNSGKITDIDIANKV
jgi:flagellar basal body-associated protein FliL